MILEILLLIFCNIKVQFLNQVKFQYYGFMEFFLKIKKEPLV